MAARGKKTGGKRDGTKGAAGKPIEQYEHPDKRRTNNPPVGLVKPENDPDAGKRAWAYDPQLQWAGKQEHASFEVPTVSLHVHARIGFKVAPPIRPAAPTCHHDHVPCSRFATIFKGCPARLTALSSGSREQEDGITKERQANAVKEDRDFEQPFEDRSG